MKSNPACLFLIISACFASCGTFRTHTEIYKPTSNQEGYVFALPDILDSFMVVINPEYGFYDYRYYAKNSNMYFFISNDTGIGDPKMIHQTNDTVTYSGKDTVWDQQTMTSTEYFWKVRYILQNPRHYDWEHERYPMFAKLSYGYINVPKKHLRKFDRIINGVRPLSDSCVIQDKKAVEWGFSDD